MKHFKRYKFILTGTNLFFLGIAIEWKRKKLNRLILKGFSLSSQEVRKANRSMTPLLLRWDLLEKKHQKSAQSKTIPVEKQKGGMHYEF